MHTSRNDVRGWLGLAGAAAAVAVDGFANAPVLGAVAIDLDAGLAAATTMAAAYFLAYGLAQPAWVLVSQSLGRVRTLQVGLTVGAAGALASALSPSLPLLTAARVVSAVGLAAVIATALAHLGDSLEGAARSRAIGRLIAGYSVGTAVGALGAGAAAALGWWPGAYVLSAVVCLAALGATVTVPGRRHGRAGTDLAPLAAIRTVATDPDARTVVALGAVEGLVLVSALTVLAPVLAEQDRAAWLGGVALAVYAAAVVVTTRYVAPLRGRLGSPGLLRIGALVAATGACAAAAWPDIVGVLLAATTLGFAWATLHATLLLWITEVVPQARGAAVAVFTAAVFSGSAAAIALAAGPLDDGQARYVFLGCAIGLIGLGLLAPALRTRRERSTTVPTREEDRGR